MADGDRVPDDGKENAHRPGRDGRRSVSEEEVGDEQHDGVSTGGQAGTSPRIENHLGFRSGISGAELAERAAVQAVKFGARISLHAEATALEQHDGYYAVALDDGSRIAARAVLIATGRAIASSKRPASRSSRPRASTTPRPRQRRCSAAEHR